MSNNRTNFWEQGSMSRAVELARSPGAGSRTSGASNGAAAQAIGGQPTLPDATMPDEDGNSLWTFILGVDALGGASAVLAVPDGIARDYGY